MSKNAKQTRSTLRRREPAQIELKAVEELVELGRQIAARYKNMQKYEAAAYEKAGYEYEKAKAEREAIENKLLPEAREKCKAAGKSFAEFKQKHCPDMGRTKLYQVLAIADGRTSIEKIREKEREKKRGQRAKDKAGLSGTGDVPDARDRRIAGSNVMSDEEAKARMARLDGEEPPAKGEEAGPGEAAPPVSPGVRGPKQQPEQAYNPSPEDISVDALAAFKKACWELFGKMLEPDRKKARVFFNEYMGKLTRQLAEQRAA